MPQALYLSIYDTEQIKGLYMLIPGSATEWKMYKKALLFPKVYLSGETHFIALPAGPTLQLYI
jgi:hypothetical protein